MFIEIVGGGEFFKGKGTGDVWYNHDMWLIILVIFLKWMIEIIQNTF